jgi:hypothetical protein
LIVSLWLLKPDLTEGGKIAGDTERIASGKFATVPAEPHSKQDMQATALNLFSSILTLPFFPPTSQEINLADRTALGVIPAK